MNDFLTRMAQLSRGETPVMTPQVPGLFGPVEETVQVETCAPTLLRQNSRAATTNTPEATSTPGEIVKPERVDMVAPAVKDVLGKASSTTGPEKSGAAVPSDVSPKGKDQIVPTETSRVPGQAQKTGDKVHVEGPAEDPDPPSPNHEVHTRVSTKFRRPSGPQPAFKAFSGNESPPVTPLVPGYESKQSAPRQIAMEMADVTESEAVQDPTVHINIGRIEVRAQPAVPASAPRPAPPKPQSTLSLNDYLKRSGRRP